MPKRIKIGVTQRRAFVIRLRMAGASLQQCADEARRKFGDESIPQGYDDRAVWQDIQRAQNRIYKDIRKELTVFRMIQLERYETMIRSYWPKAIAGHHASADKVLQAMREENKLLGLSAPQQVDMRVLQVDTRIEQLMEAMAAQRQGEAARSLGAGAESEEDSIVEGTVRHL